MSILRKQPSLKEIAEKTAKAEETISVLKAERERRKRMKDSAELGRKSFRAFIPMVWDTVEPARKLIQNWHIDAIADHLQAVKQRHIRRLAIAMPPGHLKSLEVAVMFPAWLWLDDPFYRSIFATYASDLTTRDSVRCRDLIESDMYRSTFEPDWALSTEQNAKDYFVNTRKGFRFSTSVGAKATGYRGDMIAVDDPMNAEDQRSQSALEKVIFWWDQQMSSRLDDKQTGAMIIVMQRLAENDLIGHVIKRGGYEYLRLPTEFEPSDRTVTSLGSGKVWEDPRKTAGELLFPQMFPAEIIDEIKHKELGSFGFTCQHQQRVTPAMGGMFRTYYWRYWQPKGARLKPVEVKLENGTIEMREAVELPKSFDEVIQSWDMSFKDTKGSDFVVGGVMAAKGADRFVLDLDRARMDFAKTCHAVRLMSARHPNAITKIVEDKANGPAVISALRSEIGGFIAVNPEGGKVSRAAATLPLVEAGNVYLPHPDIAPWVPMFISECGAFNAGGVNDDQVDFFSQGMKRLARHIAVPKMPLGGTPWGQRIGSGYSNSGGGSWMV